MCGLVGLLNKTDRQRIPLGEALYQMTSGLCHRGPDSAGVALYSLPQAARLKLRIKLGERGDLSAEGDRLVKALASSVTIHESKTIGEFQRLVVEDSVPSNELVQLIEQISPDFEVVSLGRSLEIIKQVGSPERLNSSYPFRSVVGTHGIGHTRMSTESAVDLSHSQPFWTHGIPDLATVHNGHITNYHKLRRHYEQRGIRFYTENDSEIISKYLASCLSEGMTFEDALNASREDFDGSYTYLAATALSIGYVRDPFGFKPLHVIDTEDFVAFATEEVALRTWIDSRYTSCEAGNDEVRIWQLAPEIVGKRT